jgi:hypothetical protein
MAWITQTITNASGSFALAHENLLEWIVGKLTSSAFMGAGNTWTVMRYVTTGDHEAILRGPGLSGTEEIYVGIKLYHDVNANYYNCKVAAFTGYLSNNTFETQPGASGMLGVPLHNLSITAWLVANGQRFAVAAKVGTPVYESFYLGKFFPFGTPGQYPYPIIAAGMLSSASATRYSETTHSMPYKGNRANCQIRFVDGSWRQSFCYPYGLRSMADYTSTSGLKLRETPTDIYPLVPIMLYDSSNAYGVLDGVRYVSGFNNTVENVIDVGGVSHLVVQDVWRTGFEDYYALELS